MAYAESRDGRVISIGFSTCDSPLSCSPAECAEEIVILESYEPDRDLYYHFYLLTPAAAVLTLLGASPEPRARGRLRCFLDCGTFWMYFYLFVDQLLTFLERNVCLEACLGNKCADAPCLLSAMLPDYLAIDDRSCQSEFDIIFERVTENNMLVVRMAMSYRGLYVEFQVSVYDLLSALQPRCVLPLAYLAALGVNEKEEPARNAEVPKEQRSDIE